MRRHIIICIFFFYTLAAQSQEVQKPTELFIIGLVHSGNKQFNHRTLFHTINGIKPDLILWELSENFERVFGLLTAHRLKIAKPSIEQLALQKYTKRNKQIDIFGFDTLIVARKKYIKESIVNGDAFHEALSIAAKTKEDSLQYEKYIGVDNSYYEHFSNGSLIHINQPKVYDNARILYVMNRDIILPMAKKYLSDTLLVKSFEKELLFWDARNDFMVKQILKYAKRYEGKRMIVLTGLSHKYYLHDKLTTQQEFALRLMHLSE